MATDGENGATYRFARRAHGGLGNRLATWRHSRKRDTSEFLTSSERVITQLSISHALIIGRGALAERRASIVARYKVNVTR